MSVPVQKSSFGAAMSRYVLIGAIVSAVLVVAVGGWAATANIAGAVVAPGIVVVDSNVKDVQHAEGGIVGAILVRNGDRVEEGDLLVRLDDTQTRAGREIVNQQLLAYEARLARLAAERDRTEVIAFDEEVLAAAAQDRRIADAVDSQRKVFAARKATVDGQVAQLGEQIHQIEQQIVGLEAQRVAKAEEVALIADEIRDLERLLEKQLVPKARVTALRREMVRLDGQQGELVAQVATLRGRISETRMRILQIEKDFQQEVLAEIADIQTEVANLRERRVAAEDQLRRVDIRAPQSGYVHELAVHTVGGVIQPGGVLMRIVPEADDLVVEARVSPADVDQVRPGQPADIMFSAFTARETPRIHGEVTWVSADLSTDEATRQSFFSVRIKPLEGEMARIGNHELVPGMPAETFIRTDDRTVLSYLIKPLADQIRLAFRET
mgnify:CR=1 FL=1